MTINTATVTMADIKAAETADLLATYNEITGKNIKKFADRKAAESQTWKAIGRLGPGEDIRQVSKTTTSKKEKKTTTPGKRDEYEHRLIHVLIKENPKRHQSRAHKKFQILMDHDGKTIKDFKDREGKYPTLDEEKGWPATELRWAIKFGLVKILINNDSKAA